MIFTEDFEKRLAEDWTKLSIKERILRHLMRVTEMSEAVGIPTYFRRKIIRLHISIAETLTRGLKDE